MRTLLGIGLGAALVAGAVALAGVLPLPAPREPPSAGEAAVIPVSTATVTRRTMEATEEFEGTLGYGGEGVIIAGLSGTYTKLPDVGDSLRLGDRIYEVDGRRSSWLMHGARPAWRALRKASANGPDIKQLEQSLKALGVTRGAFKPDRKYGEATKRAVRRWEGRTGQEQDGVIDRGQVTFLPADSRVTEVLPELGSTASPGQVVARTSDTRLVVTVHLEAGRRAIASVGDAVTVEMPDGSTAPGTISAIDSVAQTLPGASEPTVELTVELDANATLSDLDGAPVTVSLVRQTRPDVLTVPVDALLALREGGYALEVVGAGGSTDLVDVEVGLFDDAGVEIRGDIEAGDRVVVPA